jgi:predicted enzyme related to lactoylglutathione lyase
MANPVVHFEIIGRDTDNLRHYYSELFDWHTDTTGDVAPEVSDAGRYGFVDLVTNSEGVGIRGGIGGGPSFKNGTLFYVEVPNVEEALIKAEFLGGKRVMGPVTKQGGGLIVAHFTDPEGNLMGLAGGA